MFHTLCLAMRKHGEQDDYNPCPGRANSPGDKSKDQKL